MKYYPEIESNFFLSVNDEHSNEVRSLKKKIKTRDDRIEELEYDLNCANASVYELEDKVSKLEEILNYFILDGNDIEVIQNNSKNKDDFDRDL